MPRFSKWFHSKVSLTHLSKICSLPCLTNRKSYKVSLSFLFHSPYGDRFVDHYFDKDTPSEYSFPFLYHYY